MKRIAILGSTGSIGRSALAVVDACADRLDVIGLAAGENAELLASQIARYRPRTAAMASGAALDRLKQHGVAPDVTLAGAGREALFLLMLTVIVSDTAQYYSGRAFGRRLLAPQISPNKTIEGAIGGFVFGAIAMVSAGAWWLPSMPVVLRALVGVTVVTLGIVGDLFESMLKRSAGVKDSSALIPGHGGVLDRIDALLFAAPIYYVVLKYV